MLCGINRLRALCSDCGLVKPRVELAVLSAALLAPAALLTLAQIRPHPQPPQHPRSWSQAGKKTPVTGVASIQAHRNLGKAYYEQGKYPEATGEFQKVTAVGHALATDHLNLGMALMQANRLDDALGELTTAKQMDAKLVAVEYNLGIFYKRELRNPNAEAALKRVITVDPGDPAAWFNLGGVYFAEKQLEPALEAYQRVVEMGFSRAQNFYVASLFHTFTILTRLKRQDEAQKALKVHERMRDKVPGISLQNPALESGKYGEIVVPPAPVPASGRAANPGLDRVTFADITRQLGYVLGPWISGPLDLPPRTAGKPAPRSPTERFVRDLSPFVVVSDYDGDGHPDLFYGNVSGRNLLLHNAGNGSLEEVTQKAGLAHSPACYSASFADYDNSGHPSLFIVGPYGIALYKNQGDGTFSDETRKAGLAGKAGETYTRAVLFDVDNDGFLDLILTGYSDVQAPKTQGSPGSSLDDTGTATRFFRNNGDGTFSDLTGVSGLAAAQGHVTDGLFADLNGDGYTDLVLLRDDGPPLLFINQGEGKFIEQTAKAGPDFAFNGAYGGKIADFDHDGNFDLVLWSASGYRVLFNDAKARFRIAQNLPRFKTSIDSASFLGAVADLNGDGFDDLLIRDSDERWHAILNFGGRFKEVSLALPGMGRATALPPVAGHLKFVLPASLRNPGKLNLVATARDGSLLVYENQAAPSHWAEVKLNGSKSNTQGIGSVVEFKAGDFYEKVTATGEPARIFTGDRTRLDVVRVTWPNLIVQNAIDVPTDKPLEVRESERLASSCPFLYVWDGTQYRFFTDILGVAPIGELAPDGTRIKPNPEELVRLGNAPHEQNGSYAFQVTSEMREVDYVDQLRLFAVDHPASEEIYSNEIYSSGPESPAIYAVRDKRYPLSAVDDGSHDVLPLIRERDGRYPTDFRRDRILGLADVHSLILNLGDFPQTDRVALWLTGWVFWTDSNASRALMSNRRLQMTPPYLQVRNQEGQWVTVIPDTGLPSGTNRTMRVDLSGKFLSSDHHVRIVTNLCVYWDQIFFSMDDVRIVTPSVAAGLSPEGSRRKAGSPSVNDSAVIDRRRSTRELPLISADLHYRGFSTPVSDPEHVEPDWFDYTKLLAEAPWNPMRGRYTRYGPVEELMRRADDRLVVLEMGDELTVRFSGRDLVPLRPGWKRDFFLYGRGYAKDGEPNTAFPRTVEPLPFAKMSNYPPAGQDHLPASSEYRRYLRLYQTRSAHSLIAPLAPAVHSVWDRSCPRRMR